MDAKKDESVSQLKEEVASGSYSVDPELVALRMIENLQVVSRVLRWLEGATGQTPEQPA